MFSVRCVARLVKDEEGQDLVEYGLLLGSIAALGVALFPQIVTAMQSAYLNWNDEINDKWVPPDPL